VIYAPDSAFLLPCGNAQAVPGLVPEKAVGINLSPLIMQSERAGGMAMKNYQALVRRVLDTTDLQIALVPHVVWEGGDDRQPLTALYEQFRDTGRVFLVPDANCKDLKALISRLRFFIGARTHSTIAAYSTGVPTLVCGYSVKARGIALDLFGQSEGYVVPVQGLEREDMLAEAFSALFAQEEGIRDHLRAKLPTYQQQAFAVSEAISHIKI
jgi:polysaccharide pyruvyl transferase WcaK-like protein